MKAQNKLLFLLTIAAIAVIGVYAARVLPGLRQNAPAPLPPAAPETARVLPTDQIRGPANAAKTIIEFGDVECPYCGTIDPQITGLLAQHPDARLVWKDCPLPNHPNARLAAEAAQCAGDQGKYWEYHDLLIQNQDRLESGLYPGLADQLKLDAKQFAVCLGNGEKRAQVQASFAECANVGVSELPWFSINGKTFSGSNVIFNLNEELNK